MRVVLRVCQVVLCSVLVWLVGAVQCLILAAATTKEFLAKVCFNHFYFPITFFLCQLFYDKKHFPAEFHCRTIAIHANRTIFHTIKVMYENPKTNDFSIFDKKIFCDSFVNEFEENCLVC